MKKIYKILSCFFSFLFLISISPMAASAKAAATVSAEAIAASEGNIIIPVNISSETELMGFKITVEYSEPVKIKTVSRGSVTSKGNFNTNFGVFDGNFDIIWNNTSAVKADGTLFALTVDTSRLTEDVEIRLSFSQPDTFDGEYNDVKLYMNNIKITAPTEETNGKTDEEVTETTIPQTSSQNKPEATEETFNNSQMADSVDNSLSEEDKETIYEVLPEEEEDFLESVNNNMQTMLGSSNSFYYDFDELLGDYEDYFVESFTSDVVINLDSVEIQTLIDEALEEVNAEAPGKVKEKDREKFVNLVEKKVQEKLPDREPVSKKIKSDLVFNAIEYLYNISSQTNSVFNNSVSKSQNDKEKYSIINLVIVILVVSVSLSIGIFLLIKRKKLKVNNQEKKKI